VEAPLTSSNRQVEEAIKDLEEFRKNDYKKLTEAIKNADQKVAELSVRIFFNHRLNYPRSDCAMMS
jgi:polyhydroxyalkanoate synthesis regulator phasin